MKQQNLPVMSSADQDLQTHTVSALDNVSSDKKPENIRLVLSESL